MLCNTQKKNIFSNRDVIFSETVFPIKFLILITCNHIPLYYYISIILFG